MKRILAVTVVLAGVLAMGLAAWAAEAKPAAEGKAVMPIKPVKPDDPGKRIVDLAICLDTSGSMDGLIESAKQKLWAVVNELATAKPRPMLRVALYQYGNDGLSRETGWVERLSDLTDDLDAIYGKLFALKTNGGTEYVARVVKRATEDLKWSGDKKALRLIFVAGNEPATQDEATNKLQEVCKAAAARGIIVNTVFCGGEQEGRSTGWSDAAAWADGRYAAIDQNTGTVVLTTPFDKRLADLNGELNKTYVGYGKSGAAGAAAQVAQDANAGKLNPSAVAERSVAKASGLYSNAGWDVVDAVNTKKLDVAKAPKEELPVEMQSMTPEQRKAHVEKLAAQRKALQEEIRKVAVQRDKDLREQMAKAGKSDKNSLDAALRDTVRTQATAAGFEFEKK